MDDEDSNQHHSKCTHQTSWMLDNATDNTDIFMIADAQPLIYFTEHNILFRSAIRLQY